MARVHRDPGGLSRREAGLQSPALAPRLSSGRGSGEESAMVDRNRRLLAPTHPVLHARPEPRQRSRAPYLRSQRPFLAADLPHFFLDTFPLDAGHAGQAPWAVIHHSILSAGGSPVREPSDLVAPARSCSSLRLHASSHMPICLASFQRLSGLESALHATTWPGRAGRQSQWASPSSSCAWAPALRPAASHGPRPRGGSPAPRNLSAGSGTPQFEASRQSGEAGGRRLGAPLPGHLS